MKKYILIISILLVCITVIIGCGTPATTPSEPVKTVAPGAPSTGTLLPGSTAQPATPTKSQAPAATTATAKPTSATPIYGGNAIFIDPSAPSTPLGIPWKSNFAHACMGLCLEPLLIELDDGTLLPRLALSFEVDSNPKNPSVTFKLRKGVKFHDGTDFNASVAKWNLDKQTSEGVFSSPKYWKAIEIIDDYTFRLPWKEWNNSLMPPFGANMVYQISPNAYEKYGAEGMRWNMIGTGPFKQVEFVKDVSLKTVRFDDYWDKGKPYLLTAEYQFVAEELTRTALFKTGGGDILNTAGNARIAAEFRDLGYRIPKQTTGTTALVPDSVNPTSPWSNLKVRQAAEYAIDKEAIAKAFGYGFFNAAYQLPGSNSKAYNPEIVSRKYDTAKAKQLLTEAGYPNGFKTKIIATSATNRDIIVAIQSFFKAVGIEADLDFPEPAKFVTYQQGTWENALIYTTYSQSPNYNQSLGFSFPEPRTNFKSLKNPDGWYEVQYTKNLFLPTVDTSAWQRSVKMLADDCTVIPINNTAAMWVVENGLQGYSLGENKLRGWTAEQTWWSK